MSVIRRVHKIGNCGLNHPRAWDSGHYTPLLELELNKLLRHSEKVTQVNDPGGYPLAPHAIRCLELYMTRRTYRRQYLDLPPFDCEENICLIRQYQWFALWLTECLRHTPNWYRTTHEGKQAQAFIDRSPPTVS